MPFTVLMDLSQSHPRYANDDPVATFPVHRVAAPQDSPYHSSRPLFEIDRRVDVAAVVDVTC